MNQKRVKSAVSVQEALGKFQLECKVRELPNSTRTALDAAASIGCQIAHIVKSLIFKTERTNQPVLVLVSGSNQVHVKQLESHVGESVIKADAKFAKEATGFTIGGIPPIGHKSVVDFVYIDQDLLKLDTVWAAAGTPYTVFCIKVQDLLRATKGKVINIKDEP